MADIKCGRCDRHYSKFRTRCPYCGAVRNKKGKRAIDRDNATWKVVAGSAIIVVLIAAVAAVLIMTLAGKNTPKVDNPDKDNQENVGSNGDLDALNRKFDVLLSMFKELLQLSGNQVEAIKAQGTFDTQSFYKKQARDLRMQQLGLGR